MASLVADYSDSDSEIDCGDDRTAEGNKKRIKLEPESPTIKAESKVCNFFEVSDNNSDDDTDTTKGTTAYSNNHPVKIEPTEMEKLPNLLSAGAGRLPSILEATTSRIGTSVFVNPYEEAEQAKNQILEKHVKLTQAAPKKPAHQPVCWKFKKGKCHMGKNCRFFHDWENVASEENNEASVNSHTVKQQQRQIYHRSAYQDARRRPMEQEAIDDDNYMATMKKKKRFGVSDGLVPPQKAYESLQRQREKERPWTLTHK